MLIRVYYEDTDAAGVVYHSNYLNFMERARSEYLRQNGLSVAELAAEGAVFPVVQMQIDFKMPAKHDELLRVITVPVRVGGSSFTLRQCVQRESDGRLMVEALVTLACITPGLKAKRIPVAVRELLAREVQQ
jgi:acyl-CoA thioester hydrolase